MVTTLLRGISSGLLVPGISKENKITAATKMTIYIKLLRFQLDFIFLPV